MQGVSACGWRCTALHCIILRELCSADDIALLMISFKRERLLGPLPNHNPLFKRERLLAITLTIPPPQPPIQKREHKLSSFWCWSVPCDKTTPTPTPNLKATYHPVSGAGPCGKTNHVHRELFWWVREAEASTQCAEFGASS
jgi:hypothetical protein